MLLEYRDDQVIQVYEPVANDTLSPVVVELQTPAPAQGRGWALVFAFRLRDDPSNFQVFAFKLVSNRGLELLLSEVAMDLRDYCKQVPSPVSNNWIPSPVLNCAPSVGLADTAPLINLTAGQICDGFEPSHAFESQWDGRRRLELVFHARIVPADRDALRLGRTHGVPLLFSSSATASHFIAIFHAEVNRVLHLIRDGRLWQSVV